MSTKVIELLASTQADLIAYQRKHITDLTQTINTLIAERDAMRNKSVEISVPPEPKDNM